MRPLNGLARARALSLAVPMMLAPAALVRAQQANDSVAAVKTLDAVIVTAAKREERRTQAVVSAAVITRADIEASGASDVGSVVLQQAGIQVAAGTPAGTSVYLQGLGDQRVLVLLDGEPLVGRVGGGFDLSRVPASAVERIEIVQGPQSVLYGSDALGGVINIVTRSAMRRGRLTGTGVEAAVTAGSHERLDVSAAVASGVGSALAYRLDVGHRDLALAPGLAGDQGTYARRWDAMPRVTWSPSPSVTVDAGGLGVSEQQRYRSGQLFTFSDNTQLGAHAGATWQAGTNRFTPKLAFSSFEHLSRSAATSRPASDSGARDMQRLAMAELGYTGLAGPLVIDAGGELRRESISADRVAGRDRSLGGAAMYGQATYSSGLVSLLPGARVTWNDAWGTAVSPRLALLIKPFGDDQPLALRAAVGRGFRAPDFKELYLDFVNSAAGYAVKGNPSLAPERSTNYSASADWTGRRVALRASAFHNRFDDFIETTGPDAHGTFTYANVARGTTSGAELEAVSALGPVQLDGSYDYLHTHDEATGGPLLGRAAHAGRLTASAAPFAFRWSATALVTGRSPAARGADGSVSREREAFTQINLRVARALPARMGAELFAGADNVFDAKAGTGWPGFTGRQLYVGAAWKGSTR